jgi:Endonuclease NucS
MAAEITDNERLQIRDLLSQGLSSDEVSRRLGVPKMRVAAIKAHITMGTYADASAAASDLDVADLDDAADAADLKFGLERDMQEALRRNIHQLDSRLRVVDEGREKHVEAGFIDILAEDDQGQLVVIELKSAEAPESAVTQVLSYIGSLQLSEPSRRVRGVLIARDFSTRVRLAARAAGIQPFSYGYNFTFTAWDDSG